MARDTGEKVTNGENGLYGLAELKAKEAERKEYGIDIVRERGEQFVTMCKTGGVLRSKGKLSAVGHAPISAILVR